ncbi:helix-turn-helix domain-containing protein [Blastomonas sp.]|uniref:AraC family transcriptional regulator n=1 Tax=Blastomonas sp. TaxID=1909299 RepID=UPI0035947649
MPHLDYALPGEALREFVSVYYLFDSPLPHFTDGERAAIAQLRFGMNGRVIMYAPDGTSTLCSGVVLHGPTTAAVRFEIEGPFRMFGLGITAAGWGALTQRNAADFLDRVVPAASLFPRIEQHLATLSALETLPQMAAAADAILAPIVAEAGTDLVRFTRLVDSWLASEVSPKVGNLHSRSNLSERQLTRRVKQLYGMPPKYLSRKYRALRAARTLIDAGPNEADFLRDAFYDQSHMIRELKLFTGTTPNRLRNGEGEIAALIDRRAALKGSISPLVAET